MSFRETIVKALVWSAARNWSGQLIAMGVFLVLARYIKVEDFGLMALAMVFIGFVEIFFYQGLGPALVQRADIDREHTDTAFWICVLMGAVLMALCLLVAGPIAQLYREPRLAPLIRWLSLTFLLAAGSGTHGALLKRDLDYKRLAQRTIMATLGGGLVGVVLAVRGGGVWSLVAQALSQSAISTVAIWGLTPYRPGLRFSPRHFRELFSFSANMMGMQAVNYFSRRADNLLIGYFLGPVALGYYSVGQKLLVLLNTLFGSTMNNVAFPAFSRLQQDRERMLRGLYQATQLTGLVAFPAFLGTIAVATPLVLVLYGERWLPSAPVMQVLAVTGITQTMFVFNGSVLLALGRPAWAFRLTALRGLASLAACAAALPWGIGAVAAAPAVAALLLSPLTMWLLHSAIGLDARRYLAQLLPPLAASLAMLAVVLAAGRMLHDRLPPAGLLALLVSLGAASYPVLVFLIAPRLAREVFSLARLGLPRASWRRT